MEDLNILILRAVFPYATEESKLRDQVLCVFGNDVLREEWGVANISSATSLVLQVYISDRAGYQIVHKTKITFRVIVALIIDPIVKGFVAYFIRSALVRDCWHSLGKIISTRKAVRCMVCLVLVV